MKNNKTTSKLICSVCGKASVSGYNRPHSLHRTKRVVKPNTQKVQGRILCTRCLRTSLKNSANKTTGLVRETAQN